VSNRKIGFGLVALGGLMFVVSLAADKLGIGMHPEVIGWKQQLGAAVGFIVILVGVWFVSKKTGEK
jgi:hypothetical protein